ncbi:MAG: hypothetical protein V1744_03335 [Candidatus Altiarchaeota archaeon]
MRRLVLVLATVLVMSGCICCGGADPSSFLSGLGSEESEEEVACDTPYIQNGQDCCLDQDESGICDSDEGEETPETTEPESEEEVTETTETTETTIVSTTLSSPTTTVAASTSPTYECVRNAGYNPDTWFYLYSKSGRGCGDNFVSTARTAASRKGVDVTFVDITILEDNEIRMLECFYGTYSQSNTKFQDCPMMLCPKTNSQESLSGISSMSVLSQMTGFTSSCR